MKRRIYLSGGMSGVERAEYVRRFGEAEAILRRHGYGCINPCRVWACRWPWIYRAMEWAMGKRLAYAVVLCYDLLLLMTRADGIAMLPGWQESRGAQIENNTARQFPLMGISRQAVEEIDN
ncbi:MAG: DUF4406 domain-containing protein, partial [Prevotella sp.]|nr:DUF4406 domain-containing protein [Prevotella sp.]